MGLLDDQPSKRHQDPSQSKTGSFLQTDELPRFFQSLAAEQNETLRDYILLALLTGARRASLLAMRWKEINLNESIWRIPDTKNGTPQNVTLSPEAVAILKPRKDDAEKGAEFVFPAPEQAAISRNPRRPLSASWNGLASPTAETTPMA